MGKSRKADSASSSRISGIQTETEKLKQETTTVVGETKEDLQAKLEQYVASVREHAQNFTEQSKESIEKKLGKLKEKGIFIEYRVRDLLKELKKISTIEIENAKEAREEIEDKVVELFKKRKEMKSWAKEFFAEPKESIKKEVYNISNIVNNVLNYITPKLPERLELYPITRLELPPFNKKLTIALGAIGFIGNAAYNMHFYGTGEAIYKAGTVALVGAPIASSAIMKVWGAFNRKDYKTEIPIEYVERPTKTFTEEIKEKANLPINSSSLTPSVLVR